MKIRTTIARLALAAVAVVSIGGCTVSRNEYLDTAYGTGSAPSTYRVGGLREVTSVDSKVTIIRTADDATAAAEPAASK